MRLMKQTRVCANWCSSRRISTRPFNLDIFRHGPGTTPFSRAIVEKPYLLFWQHLAPAPVKGSSADLHSDMWLANASPCQVQPLPASRILHLARTSTLWHFVTRWIFGIWFSSVCSFFIYVLHFGWPMVALKEDDQDWPRWLGVPRILGVLHVQRPLESLGAR
jgi:hypothetical protein